MTASDTPDFGTLKADPRWKIAIIRSVWYPELTGALRDGAMATLLKAGALQENILTIDAPGSFELPLLSKHAIEKQKVDGVIAFGIVVQGATHHGRLVAEQAAEGIMRVQLTTNIPITFEVMFVDALDDARSRSIGPEGKGPLAAATLLSCLAKLRKIR